MGNNGAKKAENGWVGRAWRDHLNGISIYALAKKYEKKWTTVRDNLDKHAANRAAELEKGYDPTLRYVDGLEQDLGKSSELMEIVKQDTAQIGALKLRVDIRQKLAAAQGVVTERSAQEQTVIPPDLSNLTDEELATHASLLRKIAGGNGVSEDETER